jgi:glutaredoxin
MCAASISREGVFVTSVRGRADAEHTVTLVTRAGCHLCQAAETTLRRLRDALGYGYAELDVDADPALLAEYSDRVPVILIDGREHGYWRVEEPRLRKALAQPVRR